MTKWRRVALTFLATICLGRWLPHPPNWTPVGSVAVIGGTYMGPWRTLGVVMVGVWVSDMVLNNVVYASPEWVWLTKGWLFLALGYAAMTFSSHWVSKYDDGYTGVVARATVGSWLFFMITNAGVWWGGSMYSTTIAGLTMCYLAGIPFLISAWMADVAFSVALKWVLERGIVKQIMTAGQTMPA